MDFSMAAVWWVAAGAAVAVELATGTFYLLMIAIGLAAGAFATHLGLALTGQIVVVALVGAAATLLLYARRRRRPADPPAHENRDVNLDIGERVQVVHWEADRTAQVSYRGSIWKARLAPGAAPRPGEFTIAAVESNWLVLVSV